MEKMRKEKKNAKLKDKEAKDKIIRRESKIYTSTYVLSGLLLLAAMLLSYNIFNLMWYTPKMPEVDLDAWWGPDEMRDAQDTSIRPFRIVFSEAMISDLRIRFDRYRGSKTTPSLEDSAWTYGVNSEAFDRFFTHWVFKYDIQKREKYLNQYEHFRTNIQGLDIHFIRVKPKVSDNVKVLPLLLLHGWPGSVREFYEAIPRLITSRSEYDFVFELIIPSLPGYGYSDAAVKPGLSTVPMAVIMRNLMHRLGHKKYYVQGGDLGFVVGSSLATLFPEEILGLHTNMAMVVTKKVVITWILGTIWPSLVEKDYTERMYPLSKRFDFYMEEFGYMHLQSTKPDTIGFALNESPAGLAAYILEKFVIGTNSENKLLKDGGLNKLDFDGLLDNIMIYWATGSITTSVRLYKERILNSAMEGDVTAIPTRVPTWALRLKHEIFFLPEFMLKWKYPNLLGTTTLDYGGHFAAFELPAVFADDIFKAVYRFENFNKHLLMS